MIDCYKCEEARLEKYPIVKFKLLCTRYVDVMDLDYQIPECPDYKERKIYQWKEEV
jgi:hypothetical protein